MSFIYKQPIEFKETIDAVLSNSPELIDSHPNFSYHIDNLEFLVKKGIIFKDDKTDEFMVSLDDLRTFKKYKYKTLQEASAKRDEKRLLIQYLTLFFALSSFIVSIVIPALKFILNLF